MINLIIFTLPTMTLVSDTFPERDRRGEKCGASLSINLQLIKKFFLEDHKNKTIFYNSGSFPANFSVHWS
jgi:hypothetical protein